MARDPRIVGDRIEKLLSGAGSEPERGRADEIVRLLVELYGEGLSRVVTLLRARDPILLEMIAGDDLVSSLLLLHDLHPFDADVRIRRVLGDAAVDYLGIDGNGVVRLRIDGCPSSMRAKLETVIRDAAPEVTSVEVVGALLQIGLAPPPGWNPPP